MAFLDYVENLRKKPIAYRKRFAIFGAAIITGLIFLIWLSTWSASTVNVADPKAISEDLKPFKEIKTNIVNFYDSVIQAGTSLLGGQASSSASKD